jgi:RecJ-like exonuclease
MMSSDIFPGIVMESIALELMCDEMVRQIKVRSGTEEKVAAYLAQWADAIQHSGRPLPCPSCFMKGEIQRLKPISEIDGAAVVRCEHCRESFEFDSPETRER